MGTGVILGIESERRTLNRCFVESHTSFLSEDDGAVGGIPARLKEGGEAGEELCLLACFHLMLMAYRDGLRRRR